MNPGLVMYEEEFRKISGICERLTRDASAKVVFLVDKNGQLIAAAGQSREIDTTSLASLTAGNVAAMGGLAKLIGEREFPSQFHEGERESLHMSIVGGRVVLVVIFDAKSSLGLVRLRVKKVATSWRGSSSSCRGARPVPVRRARSPRSPTTTSTTCSATSS